MSGATNGSRPGWRDGLRESATFDRATIHEIQRAAREGGEELVKAEDRHIA